MDDDRIENRGGGEREINELARMNGADDIRKLICPMCGEEMEHIHQGDTHIYVCEACPFLGLEFFNIPNITDLTDYINRT